MVKQVKINTAMLSEFLSKIGRVETHNARSKTPEDVSYRTNPFYQALLEYLHGKSVLGDKRRYEYMQEHFVVNRNRDADLNKQDVNEMSWLENFFQEVFLFFKEAMLDVLPEDWFVSLRKELEAEEEAQIERGTLSWIAELFYSNINMTPPDAVEVNKELRAIVSILPKTSPLRQAMPYPKSYPAIPFEDVAAYDKYTDYRISQNPSLAVRLFLRNPRPLSYESPSNQRFEQWEEESRMQAEKMRKSREEKRRQYEEVSIREAPVQRSISEEMYTLSHETQTQLRELRMQIHEDEIQLHSLQMQFHETQRLVLQQDLFTNDHLQKEQEALDPWVTADYRRHGLFGSPSPRPAVMVTLNLEEEGQKNPRQFSRKTL